MTTLLVDRRDDGTALVTINRPEKRNAMNHAFFHDLPVLLAELDDDPEVHACVITGAGEAFSAGGDIADFNRLTDVPSYRRQVRLALGAFQSLERCETITIAAVNGLAFGGGTELTLACDLALAASDARFAFREVSVGLMPGYGLVRGPETVGRAWTRWLALTGEEIDAEQALGIGLVHRVVPPDRLVEEALAVAGRIAANPPVAVQFGKQFLNRDMASINEAIDATALLFTTEEHKKRIRAFFERRGGPANRA